MNAITYPKLSPHERFRKFIKAYANNDEGQCKKLVDSCPRFLYQESDRAYTERIQVSSDIVSTFLLRLMEYDKIISISKLTILVDDKLKLSGAEKRRLSEIYGFLLAFEEFCEKIIGLDSVIIIKAWYGYDKRYNQIIIKIKDYLMLNQVEPDKETKRQWLENVFKSTWEQRILDYRP